MVQVLGAVGGVVNVQLPPLKVMGAPTQTFGVEFGQSAYDISTTPPTLYTYLNSGWVVGDGSGSLSQFTTDLGVAVPSGGNLNLLSSDGTLLISGSGDTVNVSANTTVSQPLLFQETTLTSPQVKALAATPITLVAAPAAGSVIQFMGATLKLNYGGSNVFTESGDNLGIKYTDASGVQVCTTIEMTGFIDQSVDTYTNAVPSADAIVAATGAEAQALVLDNLGSEIAGNAADDNTLTVRVYYTVQALA